GRKEGEGTQRRADRRLLPGAVAVETEDRGRVEAPHALELRLGDGGAVGRHRLAYASAVEGDHVHIAFDDDQAPRRAAGRGGAVDVVEGAALVEQRGLGRVEV